MTEAPLSDRRTDVIRLLHAAAADGRLTLEQADQRIAAARTATSEAVLETLVSDLSPATAVAGPGQPVPVQVEQYPPVAAQQPVTRAPRPPAGMVPQHPLRLSAGASSVKRTGPWRVPPYISANGGFGGTVRLDFLEAIPTTPVIELTIEPSAGTVVVVMPQGWAVNVDDLDRGIGSVSNKMPLEPEPGCPLIVVVGSLGMCTFKARYASWWDRRRLRKASEQRREIMR